MILPTPDAIHASLAVVVSRGQSRNPEKRAMEAAILDVATQTGQVRVFDLPHLYDLKNDSDALATLRDFQGDLVVASWFFPRAAHWLLDRIGVRGQSVPTSFDETDEDSDDDSDGSTDEPRVIEMFPRPQRRIFCVDMRAASADALASEVKRIIAERSHHNPSLATEPAPLRFEDSASRRWYPVIDYSRCTNCMECIDFCLFGVYGLDDAETILVEQPDNCRKGCPACSRVCPAGAIMFPQHKAPAIAGAAVEGDEGFKIDLSLLFGAPNNNDDAIAIAARERDEQLLLAGRAAVGLPPTRQKAAQDVGPKDELDRLIDDLDRCDL